VRRVTVTRAARNVRVTAVSGRSGVVAMTLRRGGRQLGEGRRTVRAGRAFVLVMPTSAKVPRGRYTLTIAVRGWSASRSVSIR
jgi:hypothetical protein